MLSEYSVKVDEPIGRNEGTENSYELQTVELQRQTDGTTILESEAYLLHGYYSVGWITTLSPDQLVELVEKTLQSYEANYESGVKGIDGNPSLPSGGDLDMYDADIVGTIYFSKDNGNGEVERGYDLPYERPLSWNRIQSNAGENEITFARLNTPIADFCILLANEGGFKFGFLSHLAEMEGFAELVANSTEGTISKENATEFFDAMVALFNQKT